MRIGVVYPQIELRGDPEAVRQMGQGVEELGYDHLLVYDHVLGAVHADREPPLVGPYDENDPFHDPLMMLSHIAALTERIELVTGVLILPQRQTALVARQVADLDLLSGGRVRLGVGVGWSPVEYQALGQDFSTRGRRQEEQIKLLRRLWSEPVVSFAGRFDQIDRAALVPRPNRMIPIWLGGFGQVALARAAALADGFIFSGRSQSSLDHLERIHDLLNENERSVEDFGTQQVISARKGPDDVRERIERWAEAGGTHVAISTLGMDLDSADAHLEQLELVSAAVGL